MSFAPPDGRFDGGQRTRISFGFGVDPAAVKTLLMNEYAFNRRP